MRVNDKINVTIKHESTADKVKKPVAELNVIGVGNISALIAPSLTPSLTLLHNDGRKEAHDFSFDGFDAPVRNGVVFNGRFNSPVVEKYTQDIVSADKCLVKDGALSIDIPRFRVKDGSMTKTQKILEEYLSGQPVQLDRLINENETADLNRSDRLKMINDPTRRVFESYYAKYALEEIFSDPKLYNEFHDFSMQQARYIKDNFCTPEVIKQFNAAFNGQDFKFDKWLLKTF